METRIDIHKTGHRKFGNVVLRTVSGNKYVARSRNHCYNRKPAPPSLSVVELQVTVNNIK